ncbi:hypothetical protein [Haematomicrobium sanguinis]|uniref:hypothetical protein n=1 Tax=Haematomicrobium sanguinis TaxID=479106 RepID=UPI0012F9511D|nr:hypothetical protein [Haematomicrobium sanguinis]
MGERVAPVAASGTDGSTCSPGIDGAAVGTSAAAGSEVLLASAVHEANARAHAARAITKSPPAILLWVGKFLIKPIFYPASLGGW